MLPSCCVILPYPPHNIVVHAIPLKFMVCVITQFWVIPQKFTFFKMKVKK